MADFFCHRIPYECMRTGNTTPFTIMKNITNKTRNAEAISQQVANLIQSLKGWNLISGLFYAGNDPEDVVIYALAKEVRDLTVRLLELTYKLGVAAMRDDEESYRRTKATLGPLYAREAAISNACLEKLKQSAKPHKDRRETAA